MKTGIKGTLSPACSSEQDKKSKPRPWRPGSTKTREGRSLLVLEFRLLLLKSSIVLESAGNGCGAAARAGIGCEELEAGKAARLSHRAPAVSGSGPSSARLTLSPARALLREFRTFHSWLGIPGSIPSPDPAGTLPNLPWAPFPLPSFGRGAPCVQPGTAGPSQSPGGTQIPVDVAPGDADPWCPRQCLEWLDSTISEIFSSLSDSVASPCPRRNSRGGTGPPSAPGSSQGSGWIRVGAVGHQGESSAKPTELRELWNF